MEQWLNESQHLLCKHEEQTLDPNETLSQGKKAGDSRYLTPFSGLQLYTHKVHAHIYTITHKRKLELDR